jgi:outer membrane protein insertion porin family
VGITRTFEDEILFIVWVGSCWIFLRGTLLAHMRWIAICSVVLWAQLLASQVTYEGQMVSSVNLVSDPRHDVEVFRPLVKQGAKEPYSEQKIQASVAALNKTSRFSKVSVSVEPEAAGLRVSFVLEPAYYVGVLEFPGATKVFTYNRLLQVVNFPDEEVFDKERIPQATQALVQFLHTNGFFQGKVEADTKLMEEDRLANVTFTVTLGKRAKIGNVSVQGADPVETAKLLHSVRSLRATVTSSSLKHGKTYTPERVKAATTAMRRTLAKQKHLANKIQVNDPQYHAETNRVDLSFNVEVGPTVVIKTTGAKLSVLPFVSSRREKKLVPVYSEEAIDRELVNEGRQNLINFFQEKGYFDADVKTVFQRTPEQISVTYQINKGTKHKVDDISFAGNTALSDKDLLPRVALQKKHLLSHGKFSQKLLKASVKGITAAYQDAGYEDVKVTPQVVDREPEIDVMFQIAEGPQTTVANLILKGNDHYPFNELSPAAGFLLRSGAPFSPRKLADDRSRISAKYLDRGYLNVDVKTAVTKLPDDPHKVNVTYAITENQQVRVSRTVILGKNRTRESLISSTAGIRPEQTLSQGRLLEGESRLYDLGIFDWSSVGPRRPITTQSDEESLIKVHEAKRNSITYGFGLEITRRGGNLPTGTVAVPGLPPVAIDTSGFVSSEKTFVGPRGSIQFSRLNLRGLAETGTISLLASRLDQRALATYIDPQFLNSKQWRSLFSLSVERNAENPLFTSREGDVSFQVERPLNKDKTTTAQFRYSFRRTNLSDILVPELVLPEDRSVRLSTLSGNLIHDTRDKPLDPHRGVYHTLDLSLTPTALGSNANFAKLLGQYAFYKPVHSMIWANSIRLGFAKPISGSRVPTSERFFSGGGTTLRGFPINEAGPQRSVPVCTNPADPATCMLISVPEGGNQLFVLNSELRFPLQIINNLGGVVFYDGGNVYRNISFAQFVNNYTSTVGVGLRYSTPVGPVRIDVGRNLNPVPGIKAYQFFITLGQAF